MKNFYKITFLLGFFMVVFSAIGQVKPLNIGEIHKIQSTELNEERTLNVYLPPNYSDTSNFPVIYLLDGSMHEDFMHIVGVIQFFNLQFKFPQTVIVGISNVDRRRDFTFKTDDEKLNSDYPSIGHSNEFIAFLKNELKPYVQQNFKVSKENYLIGQSLGGLLACEILLKEPELFGNYWIVSPSLWWDNSALLNKAPELLSKFEDISANVYISVGAKEHKIMRKDAKKIYTVLKKSEKANLNVNFEKLNKENHATVLHNSIYKTLLKIVNLK